MTIGPGLPTLNFHAGGRIAFRDDRSREQSTGVVEQAKLDGAAMPGTERPRIAPGAAIEWYMLHSSAFLKYDPEQYVQ